MAKGREIILKTSFFFFFYIKVTLFTSFILEQSFGEVNVGASNRPISIEEKCAIYRKWLYPAIWDELGLGPRNGV